MKTPSLRFPWRGCLDIGAIVTGIVSVLIVVALGFPLLAAALARASVAMPPGSDALLSATASHVRNQKDALHWLASMHLRHSLATSTGLDFARLGELLQVDRDSLLGMLILLLAASALPIAQRFAQPAATVADASAAMRLSQRAADVLLLVAVISYANWQTSPHRTLIFEHENYHLAADDCVHGRGCPIVGPNTVTGKLGPAYIYLLALCHLLTGDPNFPFQLSLALLGLAMLLAARWINTEFGAPWGYLVGILTVTNREVLSTYHAAHAPFITLPITCAIWATARWVEGRGGKYLAVATTALALATQFHLVAALVVPGLVLAALLYRPRTEWYWMALALALPLGAYSPWLYYWKLTGEWVSFPAIVQYVQPADGAQRPLPLEFSSALGVPDILAGAAIVVLLLAAAGPPGLRRAPAAAGTLLLFLLGPLGLLLCTRSNPHWMDRFLSVLHPLVEMVVAAGLATVVVWGCARLRWQHPWIDRTRAVMIALGAAYVATSVCMTAATESLPLRDNDALGITLGDQIALARALGAHSVPAADRDRLVHGSSWVLMQMGQTWLGRWLGDGPGPSHANEHVLIVDHCSRVPDSFASWQQPVPGRVGRVMAGYIPRLGPFQGTVTSAKEVWSGRLPFALHEASQRIATWNFDPRLGGATNFRRTPAYAIWSSPPAVIDARALFERGPDDRVIVVKHDPKVTVELRLNGQLRERLPYRDENPGDSTALRYTRFLVEAREWAHRPADVEILARSGANPWSYEFDVFEEPWPACSTPPDG